MTELSDDALHLYKVLRSMVKDNKDRYWLRCWRQRLSCSTSMARTQT
jgi:hypothetical protein